eukprot:6476184-Amphidinium_carterae.1
MSSTELHIVEIPFEKEGQRRERHREKKREKATLDPLVLLGWGGFHLYMRAEFPSRCCGAPCVAGRPNKCGSWQLLKDHTTFLGRSRNGLRTQPLLILKCACSRSA